MNVHLPANISLKSAAVISIESNNLINGNLLYCIRRTYHNFIINVNPETDMNKCYVLIPYRSSI
jgi:hypothetical protein